MQEIKDHFERKSKTWDLNSKRVKNAGAIADIALKRDMTIEPILERVRDC